MRQLLLVLILCGLILACKKEGKPLKPKRFYMSVKIDGVFRETTKGYAVVEVQKNNYLTVVGNLSPTETISFSVNNLKADNYQWLVAYGIGYSSTDADWATYTNSTLNITELSSTGIKGVFQFKSIDMRSQVDKVLTEGRFEADVLYSQTSYY